MFKKVGEKMKRFSASVALVLISASLILPVTVSAEESDVVEPAELSLESAKKGDGAYSIVEYEDGRPIIARSIASVNAFTDNQETPKIPQAAELSEDALAAIQPGWLIDPKVGGVTDERNVALLTTDTLVALDEIYTHLLEYMEQHEDLYLDVQAVPVYTGLEDIMPSFVFVGFRALDADGRPIDITLWATQHPSIGYVFEGGSGYHYMAVSNTSTDHVFDYSTAEPSRKEKHEGFEQPFDPVAYFGNTGTVINEETTAEINEDNLPPGSSAVFLEHGEGGVNSMQVGVAQANGEAPSSGGGGLMTALLPFVLLGAVLLIIMDNK